MQTGSMVSVDAAALLTVIRRARQIVLLIGARDPVKRFHRLPVESRKRIMAMFSDHHFATIGCLYHLRAIERRLNHLERVIEREPTRGNNVHISMQLFDEIGGMNYLVFAIQYKRGPRVIITRANLEPLTHDEWMRMLDSAVAIHERRITKQTN